MYTKLASIPILLGFMIHTITPPAKPKAQDKRINEGALARIGLDLGTSLGKVGFAILAAFYAYMVISDPLYKASISDAAFVDYDGDDVLRATEIAAAKWARGLAPTSLQVWTLGEVVAPAILVLGWALRTWAFVTLDRFFTFHVTIRKDHKIVTDGPYRLLMHPSYTGIVMIFTAMGYLWVGRPLATYLYFITMTQAAFTTIAGFSSLTLPLPLAHPISRHLFMFPRLPADIQIAAHELFLHPFLFAFKMVNDILKRNPFFLLLPFPTVLEGFAESGAKTLISNNHLEGLFEVGAPFIIAVHALVLVARRVITEEGALRKHFGAKAWDAYASKRYRLIPFVF
ncbi:hypothetical protein HK102_010399 [Quaeritorhiza haematococci]|nr:hypothetical protein HK102_010399 [Quaeritorhiza haematococci]